MSVRTYTNTPARPYWVLERLKRAAHNPLDENGEEIRIGLMLGGGAFSTVWTAGWCIGLQKTGLHKYLKVMIGISGGAPIVSALNVDQAEHVPPVFARLIDEMQFVNFRRWGKFMDHAYLFELLGKLFPPELFERGYADLYAIVTKYPSGEGEILPLDIDVMRATTAVPLPWFCEPVKIGDMLYVDGACCRFSLQKIIDQFQLTDLLFVGPRPDLNEVPCWIRNMYWYSTHAALLYNAPPAIRHGMANIDQITAEMLQEIKDMPNAQGLAFLPSYERAIPQLPPPWCSWPFEKMDAETLMQAAKHGEESFNQVFDSLK